MRRSVLYPLCLLLIAACDEGSAPLPDAALPDGARDAPRDAPAAEAAVDTATLDVHDAATAEASIDLQTGEGCAAGATTCVDTTHQKVCGPGGWIVQACPAGTLCLAAACSAECVDECNEGETRTGSGGATETCKLFSVAKNAAVSPGTGMHDRARAYNAWLRKHHLPAGLNAAYFTDASLTNVAFWSGTGDSALWTGAYLAAEALRYQATGSADAQQNLQHVVEYVHRLFKVTGYPGFMVRYTAPVKNADPRIDALYDKTHPDFFTTSYQGTDYFYRGGTSRDAYQGPVLGLALAYEQLTSEPHRQMVREALVELCTELIKLRKGVKITVTFALNGQDYTLPFNADLQYVVLNPDEFVGGGPAFTVDVSNIDSSSVDGIREFFPDYSVFLKQVPLLGGLFSFPVYRAGSTIMLAAILRSGMLVTDGVPAYAAEHAAITAHYNANINGWIDIMKGYLFTNTGCWEKYYGLNITMTPMFNLVRLETDPALRASMHNDVLAAKMWPTVKNHKNVWFSYIYGCSAPSGTATQAVVDDASAQLALFPPAPNAEHAVDNTGKYTANPACADQTATAVDVSDRWADYFCWQKHPFYMTHPGDPQMVWPGVDYLLPYWLGRAQGFLKDDAPGTCLRWLP